MPPEPDRLGPSFAQHGYGVLEGFLDRALVEVVRQEVDAALRAPPVPGCERPHNRLVPLRWSDRAVELVLEQEQRRRAVATLSEAADLRWISAYVSTKEGHTPPLWWHQDWWCWDHPVSLRGAAPQVALLCYLSDTSEEAGALRVLPGSHRASTALHALLSEADGEDVQLSPDHPALRDQPEQVTLGARGGDAVLIDYRLLHGTHPNAARERRDALLLSFTPCWRDLPRDLRAHLIQHPAQPRSEEHVPRAAWCAELLPGFDGKRADLPLNRVAPASFAVAG